MFGPLRCGVQISSVIQIFQQFQMHLFHVFNVKRGIEWTILLIQLEGVDTTDDKPTLTVELISRKR